MLFFSSSILKPFPCPVFFFFFFFFFLFPRNFLTVLDFFTLTYRRQCSAWIPSAAGFSRLAPCSPGSRRPLAGSGAFCSEIVCPAVSGRPCTSSPPCAVAGRSHSAPSGAERPSALTRTSTPVTSRLPWSQDGVLNSENHSSGRHTSIKEIRLCLAEYPKVYLSSAHVPKSANVAFSRV